MATRLPGDASGGFQSTETEIPTRQTSAGDAADDAAGGDATDEAGASDEGAPAGDVGADGESAGDAGDEPNGEAPESGEEPGEEPQGASDGEAVLDFDLAMKYAKGDPDRAARILAAAMGDAGGDPDDADGDDPEPQRGAGDGADDGLDTDVDAFYASLSKMERDEDGRPKDPKAEAKGLAALLRSREKRIMQSVASNVRDFLLAQREYDTAKAALTKKYPNWEQHKGLIRLEYRRLEKDIGAAARRMPIATVYELVRSRLGAAGGPRAAKAAATSSAAVKKKQSSAAATPVPANGRPTGPMDRRKLTEDERAAASVQQHLAGIRRLPG